MLGKLSFNYSICRILLLTVLSTVLSGTELVNSTKKTLAQTNDSNTPLCYLQRDDGTTINLNGLCNGTSQGNFISNSQETNVSNSQQLLTIKNITFVKESRKIGTKSERNYYIYGEITNNSDSAFSNIKINYKPYRLSGGSLQVVESDTDSARIIFLEPGRTEDFLVKLDRSIDVLMIESLKSSELDNSVLRNCYGYSFDQKELCKRINPYSIQELKRKTINR